MAFVRKAAGRSGATKVQIAERRDGRNHILEHVGTARSEAELAALMAEARRRILPGQESLDLDLEDAEGTTRPAVVTGKTSAILWQVLTDVYARLGFDVVGDDAFEQLVMGRIVEPTSKADSVRVLGELSVPHASLRTMFRSLQRAQKRDYRGTVVERCFAHAATDGDLSLCMYDVTTLYFEAEHEDALRKVGFSKERRVDPQVVVGLLVDRHGFPLDRVFRGKQGREAHDRADRPAVHRSAQPGRPGRGRRRGHAVRDQPQSPGRGSLAVHRRVPHHEGTGRPGIALPVAR